MQLRFEDLDEFKDYTADVLWLVTEYAYKAGHDAGTKAAGPEMNAKIDSLYEAILKTKRGMSDVMDKVVKLEAWAAEPSNLHSSEIAAIAVSDHDCPGSHS